MSGAHSQPSTLKKPGHVHSWLLKSELFRASIWGPESVSDDDDRMASLLRIWLPLSYATSFVFGILGIRFGVPAIFDAISPAYSFVWACIVTLVSLACLVGVSFPRTLWRLDIYANSALVMGFGIYSLCLIYLAFAQPPIDEHAADRAALAIGSLRLIYLPCWRVFDIARDVRRLGWK